MRETSNSISQRLPSPTAATLLGEATSDVRAAVERVAKLTAIVRQFNDGIHGSQPCAIGSGKEDLGTTSTRAEALREGLADLGSGLSALEEQVSRLEFI